MAQGKQENEGAPVDFVFTQESLNAALARRGFRVHEGFAYGEQNGVLFPIVAPTTPDGMAHAYAEFLRNRIVANRNGVSAVDASRAAANGTLPSAKSNDAFDSVYGAKIADLVDSVKGWDADAVKKMTAEEKLARAKLIESSASDADNRAKYYDATVKAALEDGLNAAPQRETKRKAGPKVEAMKF